jgi:predicted acetyltransferase
MAGPDRLELVAPGASREAGFLAMADEFRAAGEAHFIDEPVLVEDGFAAYLDWLERGRRGELEGFAPWQALWAVDAADGRLVGVASLRHPLTLWMAEYGGHVGYRVRPADRRRGLGTRILALALERAAGLGIDPALVVCEPGNAGSIGVLRANGAVHERDVEVDGRVRGRWLVPTRPPNPNPHP